MAWIEPVGPVRDSRRHGHDTVSMCTMPWLTRMTRAIRMELSCTGHARLVPGSVWWLGSNRSRRNAKVDGRKSLVVSNNFDCVAALYIAASSLSHPFSFPDHFALSPSVPPNARDWRSGGGRVDGGVERCEPPVTEAAQGYRTIRCFHRSVVPRVSAEGLMSDCSWFVILFLWFVDQI